MIDRTYIRFMIASVAVAFLAVGLAGCSSKSTSDSKKLDGVYRSPSGSPMTLTIKGGKAIMTIGTESKTLDYKVEGNKLTLIDPKEGNAEFVINDDGSLNSQLGVLQKTGG